MTSPASEEHPPTDAEVEAFVRTLIERASRLRLPGLFGGDRPSALRRVPNRHGVSTVVLRTASLTREELIGIMTYRLVQYLLAKQLDPHLVYAHRLEHEPLANVSATDVHLLAGTEDGELLCYCTMEFLADAPGAATLAVADRPLFPVERVFGHGVFGRLRVLPDTPVSRICEFGRFAKNHQYDALDERILRAPVEILLAIGRVLTGPLAHQVDACIGDIEVGAVKKNLDFFHLPIVLVRGVVPYTPEGSFGFYNYQNRTRYPFAFLTSDISVPRHDAVESALGQPGKEGLMALLALKGEAWTARSGLEPPGGLPTITETTVPQQGVPMASRRQSLALGAWLRTTRFFESLSVAEGAVLGTFLERCQAKPGEAVVRQGEAGDALYLIEAGSADVQVVDRTERRFTVATLGPGDCFGEIALVTGGERTADVVAATPLALLRLTRDAYARYLAHLVDVESRVTRTALVRAHDTLQAVKTRTP